MYLRRSPFPVYAAVLCLCVSFVLATAGCATTKPGDVLDATADAATLDDGGTLDDGRVDDDASAGDAELEDASLDDASLDDASFDDASLDDASLGDAMIGTLCDAEWVDIAVDVHHCGGCDQDCTLLPGVYANGVTCASGTCVLACDAHRADCDGAPENGCESTLDAPARCGACDVSCAGTTPVCDTTSVPAICVSGCAPSQDLCGDACVDLDSALGDCGFCGNACPSPAHASALCDDGTCAIACDTGYHDCGGACLDDTDVASCGAACAPCVTDPHGTTGCELGTCTLSCALGYALVAGHCANIDECTATPGLCGPGAIGCDDLDGSYGCSCDAGFMAPAMGGACEDVNECVATPALCGAGGTGGAGGLGCTNASGHYMCTCRAGYTSPPIDGTCNDVDECAATPGICGAHGTGGTNGRGCTNVDGAYACSCRSGAFAPPTGGVCATTCGDGIQGPDETCDDGAQLSNDGCSSTCRLEMFAGWSCTGAAPTRCAINWTFDASSEGFSGSVSGSGLFVWNGAAHAWGANASTEVSDFALASPTRVAPPGTIRAVVVLTHALNFQTGRDGGVVEVSIDGGAFTGIGPVSGQDYTHWLGVADSNPLHERLGFSGQLASTTSTFNVPVTAGHEFRIRFRVGTEQTSNNQPGNPAWLIDNVSVTFVR